LKHSWVKRPDPLVDTMAAERCHRLMEQSARHGVVVLPEKRQYMNHRTAGKTAVAKEI
jgi:hypothetical protein